MKKQMLFDYRKFIQELPEEEKKQEIERIKRRKKGRKEQKRKIFKGF
ncbi:hypothetical protein IJM86_03005 [bacterium]|nr:hypothetical protein [bacterium]